MKFKTVIIILAIFVVLLLGAAGFVFGRNIWKQTRERNARLYLLRGYRYALAGEFESAVRDDTKAIRLSPGLALAYYDRGDAYFRLKAFEDALHDFNQVIKLQPTNFLAVEYRGLTFANKGDYSNAIINFSAVIKKRSNDGNLYYKRGFAYSRQRNWTNAIADCAHAIRLISTNAAFYNTIAFAYLKAGDPTNAVKNFKEALRVKPDDAGYLNNLAWFFAVYPDAVFRDGASAVNLASEACKQTDWRKRGCVDTLAAAYAETGDFTNAVKYQKQALRMDGATDKEDLEQQERLKLYQHNQPFRETSAQDKSESPPK